MNILEDFWYGNIEPSDYDASPCAEYKEALQLINQNEAKLRTAMTDAQKELATSKNCFLVFWVRDFVLTKVLEIPEYWMYCGIFNTNCEGKRSSQNPKG